MRYALLASFATLTVMGAPCGTACAQPPSRDVACEDLLDRSERLLEKLDEDTASLAYAVIRSAQEPCGSPEVAPELRARALMRSTYLPGNGPAEDRELWLQAVELLRSQAPESRQLPRALEGLSSAEFATGSYGESLRLAREALAAREQLFGAESREVVRGLALLAATYQALAQVEEPSANLLIAQSYAEDAVNRSRRLFGLADRTTAAVTPSLTAILRLRGFAEEADRLEQENRPYIDLADSDD